MNGGAAGEEFAAYVSEQFTPLVRRWSHSVDGVIADAEEVVQDSLIALARKWPDVDNVDGWMHRVCERRAARIVHQRQHPVRGAVPLDNDYAESLTAGQDNPAADSEAYQLARELVSGTLEWEILNLHAEGYTLTQIADSVRTNPAWNRRRMGCTPANIGKMLRREKERLSREITQRLAARGADFNDQPKLIMRAILRLPEKQRQAFGLRLLGYEPVKIAARMRSQPMTARANLSHANRKLADAFGMDPCDATRVPEFVTRNLDKTRCTVLLGATLPDGATLDTSFQDSPDAIRSLARLTLHVAFEIGRIAMAESPDPSSLLPAISDRGILESVIQHGAVSSELKELASQLTLGR